MDGSLLSAVQNNDQVGVRSLIEGNANPNARDPKSGLTLLMIAAGQSQPAIVRALLDAGADPLTADTHAGGTALHKACQGGSLECARLLVEAGAFVDAQCVSTGHTPLIEAIWFKHPDIAKYLLDQGAGLKIDTHYGFTLRQHLDYALNVNEIGRELLVESDEAVRARQARDSEEIDKQLLMAAVQAGDLNRVKTLLAVGVEVDERYPILNGFDDAHTPLLVACRDGHTEIVTELLNAGADVNATEPTFGAVPLHKAVYNGHDDITAILVRQPNIALDFQGYTNGYTALLDAIWHGFEECSLILIRAGARLDLMGHDGKTAAQLAEEIFGDDHEITQEIRRSLSAKHTTTQ